MKRVTAAATSVAALLAGLAALSAPSASRAADTFQGTIWSLTYSGAPLPDADPLHETFRITLGVDTDGYTGGGSFLDQVALKVASAANLYFPTTLLFDAPGGTANWSLANSGLSASGCAGGASGFVCSNSLASLNGGKDVAINPGNGPGVDYSWVFDISVNNGTLFTGLNEASLKARFVDAQALKVGDLISEHITLIPEPEIYAMLAAGLGLMGFVARRRRKSQERAAVKSASEAATDSCLQDSASPLSRVIYT